MTTIIYMEIGNLKAKPIFINEKLHSNFKSAASLIGENMKSIAEILIKDWLLENESLSEDFLNGIENKAETENQEVSG